MAVRLCTNLVLLNRMLPFVAMLLEGGPGGIASSVEEHKRVWQLPVDGRMSEIGEDWSREICTRILDGVDQWGLLRLGQRMSCTEKQHRRKLVRYPGEVQISEKLTHGASPLHQLV
jgi:hypothetical protein